MIGPMTKPDADSLRRYLDLLVGTLDEPVRSGETAQLASLSRFHFDRLVRAGVGEPPAALRRRLLLERAAHALGHSQASVTDIALDAGYQTPSAFVRAFRAGFGAPPTTYRRGQPRDFRIRAPNGIHFHPPSGVLVSSGTGKEASMDLIDRLIDHDLWLTDQLLERAGSLEDEALDRQLELGDAEVPLVSERTLRGLLGRLVFTKEMWSAAIDGRAVPAGDDESVAGLRRRFTAAAADFRRVVTDVRAKGRWNDAFIDTTCDPPEAFTFGGAIAHVMTFSAYRREVAIGALRRAGIDDLGFGDPIAWERSLG